MNASRFTVIWEFQVKPDSIADFEQIYGPAGAWAQLFRLSPDFRGTDLLRDPDCPGRYLTLDHWTTREALSVLKRQHQAEYSALDRRCESLSESEQCLGDFEPL